MRKQSGFTLIELMVVMAIIAILATAGLAAYTGYIKKARDATRIADLAAINSIVLSDMAADGLPPAIADIVTVISGANNGQAITDPLGTANCHAAVATSGTGSADCDYTYYTCNSGTGYAITAIFESPSNTSLYSANASGTIVGDATNYDIGSCQTGTATAGQIL